MQILIRQDGKRIAIFSNLVQATDVVGVYVPVMMLMPDHMLVADLEEIAQKGRDAATRFKRNFRIGQFRKGGYFWRFGWNKQRC